MPVKRPGHLAGRSYLCAKPRIMDALRATIEAAWNNRQLLKDPATQTAIREVIDLLDLGKLRCASPTEKGWEPVFRVKLKGNRRYMGELRVTSANAEPARASFSLIPNGNEIRLEIDKRTPVLGG